jgi:hypothetical protein
MSPAQPKGEDGGSRIGNLALWTKYFDQLDQAMHDFEVLLSRHDVEPLRFIQPPPGRPPQVLRPRWLQASQRIRELEFRAQTLRAELRAEFARLSDGRRVSELRTRAGYGSSLDVSS